MNRCIDTFNLFKKSAPRLQSRSRQTRRQGRPSTSTLMPCTRDGNQSRSVDKRISGRSVSTLVLYCVTSDFKRTVTGLCSGQIDKKKKPLYFFPLLFFPPASWFLEISSIFHWVTEKSGTLPPPPLPLVPVLPRVLETGSGIRNKMYDADCISFGLSLHLQQSH